MSNSVVPAAAAAHAKQLVQNKKLSKRTDDQRPAQDEQQPAEKDDDAAHVTQVKHEAQDAPMSETSLSSDFSFVGALASAEADSASLAAESSAQDDGGSVSDDGDGMGGTVLLVGAVGLAGLGVAVLAGGGGHKNEAPDITSGSTATVAENAAATTVVYQAAATDPDGDALTYSLSGADAAALSISSTGAVTLKAPADFETKASYAFNVVVSDGELTDTQAVTLTVTNVDEPPAFTSGTTASVAENSDVATVVYDANVSSTGATFAITGDDASAFTIDPDTGEVRFVASPNFEAQDSYDITVTATDALGTTSQDVTVSVTDVNEAPVADPNNVTDITTAEDQPASFTLVYTDPEGGAVNYSVGDDDGPANGDVTVGDDGAFVYTPDADFTGEDSFTVTIADDEGETTTQVVNVVVGVGDDAITISEDGSNVDDDNVNTTYTVVLGDYEYTITGLDAGADNIIGPDGITPSVINNDFDDGAVTLQYAANNQIALITVDGLTAEQDGQIFGVNSFNNVFGAGTIA
jgi:hypothetical protein